MRRVIIIQARVGSVRVPFKVLARVHDKPLISHQWDRLQKVANVDQVVVATTSQPEDDQLCQLCEEEGIAYFRGSSQDVLARFHGAAQHFKADVIIRSGGDCPLIDPVVVSRVIQHYLDQPEDYDYVSNVIQRTFPRGMDTEVFPFSTLDWAHREAQLPAEREHVTPYIYRHPERFRLGHVAQEVDLSHHRWTVDTEEDLALVSHILTELGPENQDYRMQTILNVLADHPGWSDLNRHVQQRLVEI